MNPTAGRGAGARAAYPAARAFRDAGWHVDVVFTERPGDGRDLAARGARDGFERIVVVGGDGTVHEVANGLLAAGAAAPLGVVPAGSGNDFAKLVGTYRNGAARAAERVAAACVRCFDVGHALGEFFVNSLGAGFGPHVVQVRNAMTGLRGGWSYLVPIVRAFFTFQAPDLDVATSTFSHQGPVMLIEVCNGTTAGGSYHFAPAADPADGLFDVCLVQRVGLGRFLLALPRVMRGRHGSLREVTMFQTGALTIHARHAPLVVHLDGELREAPQGTCRVTVEAGRLRVLAA